MGNRTLQDLPAPRRAGKWRVRGFHADMNLTAKIPQAFVAHHCAGQKSGFEENLKTVADAENQPAGTRKSIDCLHHGRKSCNGAGTQIIAVSKATRKNNRVEARDFLGLVPDEFNRLADDRADCVVSVVVAIRAGKLDHAELHKPILPHLTRTTFLRLAGFSFCAATWFAAPGRLADTLGGFGLCSVR